MRTLLAVLFLALVPLLALAPTAAACEVVTVSDYPDTNFVTACVLEDHTYGDGTQTFDNEYLVHVTQAHEADPVFAYGHANAEQGVWTYDDGETRQERAWSDTGVGVFQGARGLVGWGAQGRLAQRDQTSAEPEGGDACSSHAGRSTCAGASAWFTVQGVAGVGVGAYHTQTGSGSECTESNDLGATLLVAYVPVSTGPRPCSAEAPWAYGALP